MKVFKQENKVFLSFLRYTRNILYATFILCGCHQADATIIDDIKALPGETDDNFYVIFTSESPIDLDDYTSKGALDAYVDALVPAATADASVTWIAMLGTVSDGIQPQVAALPGFGNYNVYNTNKEEVTPFLFNLTSGSFAYASAAKK